MNLRDVMSTPVPRKKKKRVGRGNAAGGGTTAGRGSKGQKSRSGYSRRLGFEGGQMPLIRRIPKRGFNNKWRTEYAVINVAQLERLFNDGDTVDVDALLNLHIVGKKDVRDGLKILGHGDLNKKLTVKATAFSQSAREKIEAAGGTVEEIA